MAGRGTRAGAVAGAVAGVWLAVAPVALAADGSVGIYDFTFAPPIVTIQAGEAVTWTNGDRAAHTATGSGWATGTLAAGESASVTFANPGTFPYVCAFHGSMSGTVVVEAADPGLPDSDTAAVPAPDGGADPAGGVPARDAALLVIAAFAGAGAWLLRATRTAR